MKPALYLFEFLRHKFRIFPKPRYITLHQCNFSRKLIRNDWFEITERQIGIIQKLRRVPYFRMTKFIWTSFIKSRIFFEISTAVPTQNRGDAYQNNSDIVRNIWRTVERNAKKCAISAWNCTDVSSRKILELSKRFKVIKKLRKLVRVAFSKTFIYTSSVIISCVTRRWWCTIIGLISLVIFSYQPMEFIQKGEFFSILIQMYLNNTFPPQTMNHYQIVCIRPTSVS